jgi:uridine phosphorylase
MQFADWDYRFVNPYCVGCSDILEDKLGQGVIKGITATASGFYGPQGRKLRLNVQDQDFNKKLEEFRFGNLKVTNFEMETSALYGLSKMLGHQAVTICVIIANRFLKEFSKDYKTSVNKLILQVLDRLTNK